VIVIYFVKKTENSVAVLYSTVPVLFKTDFLVELGSDLLFPKEKRCSEQD
jgi:hypothetical protein